MPRRRRRNARKGQRGQPKHARPTDQARRRLLKGAMWLGTAIVTGMVENAPYDILKTLMLPAPVPVPVRIVPMTGSLLAIGLEVTATVERREAPPVSPAPVPPAVQIV